MTRRHQAPAAPCAASDAHGAVVRIVSCPQCGGDSVFAPSNPFRPFCSRRCKDIDFGAWADESFRVPDATDPDASARTGEGPLQ